jgi:hypothetical protein
MNSPVQARPGRLPLVQHATHGGDGGEPHGSRLPPPAGAPVGAVGAYANADVDAQSSSPGIVFHTASAIDETDVAHVQATLLRRTLRAFVGRGLMEQADAKDMLGYQHSGFSVDAGVCIEADDRAALERLLRYCARPPFAMDRLRKEGASLVYRCATQQSEPGNG